MASKGSQSAAVRPTHEYWGDGLSVALVSSRVPPEDFYGVCWDVFWWERREVVRVVRADLMPAVACRLRPVGLRVRFRVSPDLPLRRWLVWSATRPKPHISPRPPDPSISLVDS